MSLNLSSSPSRQKQFKHLDQKPICSLQLQGRRKRNVFLTVKRYGLQGNIRCDWFLRKYEEDEKEDTSRGCQGFHIIQLQGRLITGHIPRIKAFLPFIKGNRTECFSWNTSNLVTIISDLWVILILFLFLVPYFKLYRRTDVFISYTQYIY